MFSNRNLAKMVMLAAIICLVIGVIFVFQSFDKQNQVQTAMRAEKVTYLLPAEEVAKGNVIDTATEAEAVANSVKEHRHAIAATYNDLLKGGRFDPTNPTHLMYNQAINLENYLYLGVLALGLTQVVLGAGAFMLIAGLALGAVGVVLLRLSPATPRAA